MTQTATAIAYALCSAVMAGNDALAVTLRQQLCSLLYPAGGYSR